jgi:hypothetical protein
VVIKFAARADLHHLELFLMGRQAEAPQEALQVLDIVLRELPTAWYNFFLFFFSKSSICVQYTLIIAH